MSIITLVLVPLLVMALVVVAVAALRPRSGAIPLGDDPAGVRSYVSFTDGDEPPSGEPAEAGEPWALALAERLGGQPSMEDYGWIVAVEQGGERFVVRVGLVGDQPERWLAMVDRAHGALRDQPALRALLGRVDAALREAGALAIAWHRREAWIRGERAGTPGPIDGEIRQPE
jgi:hypothetical protein